MSALRNLYSQVDNMNSGVLFQVDKYYFSINTLYVREITSPQKFINIRNKDRSVRGTINIEKELIPVLDLRVALGLKMKPFDDRTSFIIMKVKGRFLGVIVDKVMNILNINKDELEFNYLYKEEFSSIVSGSYKSENGEVLMIDPHKLC